MMIHRKTRITKYARHTNTAKTLQNTCMLNGKDHKVDYSVLFLFPMSFFFVYVTKFIKR